MRITPVQYNPFAPGMQLASGTTKPYKDDIGVPDMTLADMENQVRDPNEKKQPTLTPVDYDPFKASAQPKLTPVDYDPFAPTEASTFSSRVQGHVDKRKAQMQGSADAYVAGEQSMPETMIQQGLAFGGAATDTIGEALSTATPQPVKDLLAGGAKMVGKLPSFSGRTLGEDIPQELGSIAEAYPRLARNAQAGADALSIAGTGYGIKSAINVADQLGTRAFNAPIVKNYLQDERTKDGVLADTPKIDDLGKAATESYEDAAYIGAKFTPDQVSNRLGDELERALPKPIAGKVLTDEDKVFITNLKEYEGLKGQDLTLDDIKRLDETLSAKITAKFIDPRTGMPDANGRRLQQFQHKMRKIIDDVNDPGNDALINGRTLWAAHRRVQDLEAIAERASVATSPERALQAGYRALYNDKDAIRGWPEEAVELLKKAATPGIGEELLSPITSRLLAIVAGGSGNLAAGATAHLGGMATRGLKGAVIARRGSKVQQAITEDAISKVRPIKYPSPSEIAKLTDEERSTLVPKLLASPDKMTPMMTDQQVGIAQRLMAEPKPGVETSAVIKTPTSQLTKMTDKLSKTKRRDFDNIVQIFKDGDMSQNQFVKDVTDKFGLNTKQARELAKEIKTYGDKQ